MMALRVMPRPNSSAMAEAETPSAHSSFNLSTRSSSQGEVLWLLCAEMRSAAAAASMRLPSLVDGPKAAIGGSAQQSQWTTGEMAGSDGRQTEPQPTVASGWLTNG